MKTLISPQMKRKFANLDLLVYIGPYLLFFFIFTILPVIVSYFIAFCQFNTMEFPQWVGLENFRRLFLEEEYFGLAMSNSLVLAAVSGPVNYLVAFAFSWALNEIPSKPRTILTMLFYLPSLSGGFTFIIDLLFSGDRYGYLNSWLIQLDIVDEPIIWSKDEDYMLLIAIIIMLWSALGTQFLIFLSSLQSVDKTLYEAAAVDGITNRWQELYYITLPSIKSQLMLNAILSITGAVNITAPALFGFPTNNYKLYTVTMLATDYSTRLEMGYVTAISSLLLLISVLLNKMIQFLISKIGT